MRAWSISLALALSVLSPTAHAQTSTSAVQVDARAEVASALYAASATQAAAERVADAQLRAQAAEIERLRREGRASRLEIAALQERFVDELTRRDRAYAQEIAVFRGAVEDIASTPEGAAALARFNAGDEVGALAVLDQLVNAREHARQVRAAIETAAERRRVATLALEAHERGGVDTTAVIARYEEVTRLDPDMHWDWVELGRLYREVGRLDEALRANQNAERTSLDDSDRILALGELAQTYLMQNELGRALQVQAQLIPLARRQADAAADPAARFMASYQLAIVLTNAGVMYSTGDESATASELLQEALQILGTLRNDVCVCVAEGRVIALVTLGHTLRARNELQQALAAFEEAETTSRELLTTAPPTVTRRAQLALTIDRQGDVLKAMNDQAGAIAQFQESLRMLRELGAENPNSEPVQRLLGISLARLAQMDSSEVSWSDVYRHFLSMQERGLLTPLTEGVFNLARERSEAQSRTYPR